MAAAPLEIACARVRLAPLGAADAEAFAALVVANRERLSDSFPATVAEVIDAPSAARYIASKQAEWTAGAGFWYGIHAAQLIGQIQIKRIDPILQRAELGYWIAREHEGRGLASEAMRAILATCFGELALRKVYLRTVVGYARSAQLARRFGFTLEGTLRQEFRTGDGRIVDLCYFGRLAGDVTGP